MSFESNSELFEAIKNLLVSLKESGNHDAAAIIVDGCGCMNGLSDGWALLMDALDKVSREQGPQLSNSQREAIESIQACVEQIVVHA